MLLIWSSSERKCSVCIATILTQPSWEHSITLSSTSWTVKKGIKVNAFFSFGTFFFGAKTCYFYYPQCSFTIQFDVLKHRQGHGGLISRLYVLTTRFLFIPKLVVFSSNRHLSDLMQLPLEPLKPLCNSPRPANTLWCVKVMRSPFNIALMWPEERKVNCNY